ncbi:hypothetical protein BBJ29_005148 [Phytophthora kernoviae]|uniref:Ion transport domain-containing protein n=1 Tax=Phytophthora kernoviae TaxID=325452 RepID=A0A3R7JJ09_9STRA|nr:hypothetical protein BBJ29_005148 [Phytophthora kernoviae]
MFLYVSTVLFTVEYMLRLWSCVEDERFTHPVFGRLKWMIRPMSVIDLVVLVPFYLEISLENQVTMSSRGVLTLRGFRLLRIMSFLHLERSYQAMKNLREIFALKKEELGVVSYLTIVIVLTSSTTIFFLENPAQPEVFSSIGTCSWWAIETITSLGYGDIVPITAAGRAFSSLLALWGIILFTIPGAVLGSGHDQRRRPYRHSVPSYHPSSHSTDADHPYLTDKLAMFPSVFPTNANFPEEKFRFHALRNAAFVSPLPRGFNQQWHMQYSVFSDKKLAIFDDLTRATRAIVRIREDAEEAKGVIVEAPATVSTGAEDGAATANAVERAFTSYLIRHVRRLDERTSHIWMTELANGTKSAAELAQAYGVPFKQWRAVQGVSKCSLLEFVVRYRPGYAEATWFVRLNVVYTEMRELQRDNTVLLLVRTVLQHLRYLLPPGRPIPVETTGSTLQEELLVALCQMLRDVLLNCNDVLVRLEENDFIFTDRFFNRDAYGATTIQICIDRCQRKNKDIAGRILRLHQACPSLSSVGGGHVFAATMRNEAQVLQTLDRFHRVDSTLDLHRVYSEVFGPLPTWAVTNQRPAEYRYLSALALIEMHSNALLEFGKDKGCLPYCGPEDHQVVLQSALQNFLHRYEPKVITEVTQVIELFCLLVRRRLFSVASFVEFASCCNEAAASMNSSPLLTLAAGAGGNSGIVKRRESAPVVHTAYNIECSPGRGYKSNDIHLLSSSDRLKLFLWQLPRSAFPLPTCVPMIPEDSYDGELAYLRWLEVMELRRDHLICSKTLDRAQSLCVYVFHTHGQANDTPMVGTPGSATPAVGSSSSSDNSRVLKEVEYQGKVGELVSAVKTMCGHDKGRFARWFLHNIYEEPTFFRFSDFGSVEHVMRLVCLILEIVDVLALLEVLVHFLRRSPCFLVKNVVLAMIERHELAFCATDQILFLLQSFVDRFNNNPKNADDKTGNVAQFFCKMYYAHIKKKEIAKLDLPFALLRPIAETARKNQESAAGGNVNGTANANGSGGANGSGQKAKELSLETPNPIVRIPPPREVLPPELKSALARSFKALQARAFDGPGADGKQTPATPGAGSNTPLQSPDSQGASTSTETMAVFDPGYSSLSWQEVVGEATPAAEAKCRDTAVDFAVAAINMSMTSSSVGSTNANATRERRTPNYVFFFRAVLSEAMDKWMANISARVKTNCKRPITTPHYLHRCVRLIREVVEQHPDNGEEFNEKFSNTLVVWLQKEVLPGFAGSDTPKRSRNPFLNADNSKEAFALNQKGRLDRLQYGLKSFLVSLVVHKVLDLSQVLRLVLVPLFPRLRRASRDPPPNLPTQLLAMALVFQLFSEPPQNLLLEPQKLVMFDEPLISYQMEDNFLLRKREERGTLASVTLFNLTSDGIVRDIVFHDTKEAREKHILPVYHKKQWHTAVLLTHFFRPPTSPAEDANGQVQLLKVDQIIDQMNVWTLHRGGSIYLDLQMSRQQQKVKRSKKRSQHQHQQSQQQQLTGGNKRKASSEELSTRSSKRAALENGEGPAAAPLNGFVDNKAPLSSQREKETLFGGSLLSNSLSDGEEDADDEELEIELGFDESSSATEILSSLIVLRTLKRSSRPAPGVARMLEAAREAQDSAVASLYAATVCSISRRAMGSVIAKVLQILEDDVKHTQPDKFSRQVNTTSVVHLVSGIMCTHPGNAFLPRYMMSLATQLEWLYEGCALYDKKQSTASSPGTSNVVFLRRLRCKLAVRLQLVGVIGPTKHAVLTICYRDRIVKTLFTLLGTSVVCTGPGLSLFSWILDLIPIVNASVLHDKQFELIEELKLPIELKKRVWSVLPRPMNLYGATNGFVSCSVLASDHTDTDENNNTEYAPVDPWGLLEHAPQLPSDALVPAMPAQIPKRPRRVFRCV